MQGLSNFVRHLQNTAREHLSICPCNGSKGTKELVRPSSEKDNANSLGTGIKIEVPFPLGDTLNWKHLAEKCRISGRITWDRSGFQNVVRWKFYYTDYTVYCTFYNVMASCAFMCRKSSIPPVRVHRNINECSIAQLTSTKGLRGFSSPNSLGVAVSTSENIRQIVRTCTHYRCSLRVAAIEVHPNPNPNPNPTPSCGRKVTTQNLHTSYVE